MRTHFNILSKVIMVALLANIASGNEVHEPEYNLPDPLVLQNGEPVIDETTWFKERRPEILELFREHVYGRRPGPPDGIKFESTDLDTEALDGTATLRRINIILQQGSKSHSFEVYVFIPNAVKTPAPLFLLTQAIDLGPNRSFGFWPFEMVIDRGYAIGGIHLHDVAADNSAEFRNGVISLFDDIETERASDAWGGLAAWGWAASRALDYFETDRSIDESRVVLLGHSRGGKAALWGGAEDQRVAIAISNQSGCGGAALSRRKFGERISVITHEDVFHYWFCPNFKKYADNESALPVDQHMLIALMAPRPVYVASAEEDHWADPLGEFLSAYYANPVYKLLGKQGLPVDTQPAPGEVAHGTIGYHIRSGEHDLLVEDWQHYLDFADLHFGIQADLDQK